MEAVQLKGRDFVLLVDNSGSMERSDTRTGRTRFKEAEEATIALAAKAIKYDPDGLTLYIFNTKFVREENVTSAERVAKVFDENEPTGSTGLDYVLADVFKSYLDRKAKGQAKPEGEICVIITDGEPDSPEVVKSQIEKFTQSLDKDEEYGILFIQSGRDHSAHSYLKSLDDGLSKAKFDIVDVVTMDEVGERSLTEVLAGAISD